MEEADRRTSTRRRSDGSGAGLPGQPVTTREAARVTLHDRGSEPSAVRMGRAGENSQRVADGLGLGLAVADVDPCFSAAIARLMASCSCFCAAP